MANVHHCRKVAGSKMFFYKEMFFCKEIRSQWVEWFAVSWACAFLQQKPKEFHLIDVFFPERNVLVFTVWITDRSERDHQAARTLAGG